MYVDHVESVLYKIILIFNAGKYHKHHHL